MFQETLAGTVNEIIKEFVSTFIVGQCSISALLEHSEGVTKSCSIKVMLEQCSNIFLLEQQIVIGTIVVLLDIVGAN